MAEKHFTFFKETKVNPKRFKQGFGFSPPIDDIPKFGKSLLAGIRRASQKTQKDVGGYDERLLFKVGIPAANAMTLETFKDVEVIAQEGEETFLLFANEESLKDFETRINSLIRGEKPTYENVIKALKGFDSFSSEDRKSWALKQYDFPTNENFILDVELWPLGNTLERQKMTDAFERWLEKENIEKCDRVSNQIMTLYRLRTHRKQGNLLLNHRDVRCVDLPPHLSMSTAWQTSDIQDFPIPPSPPSESCNVGVLDSGLATNHPLIKSAVGDAQDFSGKGDEVDGQSHGTFVAGKVLYGNLEEKIDAKEFIPEFTILSGKVFGKDNEDNEKLIENSVEDAVRYFYENYQCRIFNLSYGDTHKPHLGGRIRGLAITLDRLSREIGILFIVPTGNYNGTEDTPKDWVENYPQYLFSEDAVIIDPAPAINVLTIGSMAL